MNIVPLGLALGLLVGAGEGEPTTTTINTCVELLEMDGLEWREKSHGALTPIGQQGAVTIWSAPRSAHAALTAHAARTIAAPRMVSNVGTPATIRTGQVRNYVASLERMADGPVLKAHSLAFQPTIDECQDGLTLSVTGRPLDQGVLARLELEESQIAAMHVVKVRDGVVGTPELGAHASRVDASYQVPEVLTGRVAGEWLVPRDGILILSLGARTVRDESGKARLCERVVVLDCTSEQRTFESAPVPVHTALAAPVLTRSRYIGPAPKSSYALQVAPQAPICLAGAILHAPLSPVLLVQGVPCVVRTHEATAPGQDVDAGFSLATLNVPATTATTVPDRAHAGMPEIPSRAIPQGFAANGRPVPLPPLPPESVREPEASAEARGTPQAKSFRPATVPVESGTPVPPPAELAAHPGRVEFEGDVTILTRDGTVIEAESLVFTPPAECPTCQQVRTADRDAAIRRTNVVEARTAGCPSGVSCEATATAPSSDSAITRMVRIPVLGGAVEVKVRVSHGREPVAQP